MRAWATGLLLIGCLAGAARAQGQIEWSFHKTPDGAHPDGFEQAFLWHMNRARSDPSGEGAFLAELDEPNVLAAYAFYGVDLDGLEAEFAALAPVAPAAFDRRLYQAAREHAQAMIDAGAAFLPGQLERLLPAGFVYASSQQVTGNAYGFARSVLAGHAVWNANWGEGPGGMLEGRPHRAALMSGLANAGVAVLPEANGATSLGPLVVVANYADASAGFPDHHNLFVVGTVWEDLDADGLYDAGEGVAGVTVRPSAGPFFAVSAAGGGYAIPVTSPPAFALHFSGGGVPARRIDIAVGAQSELVDYVVPEPRHAGAGAAAGLALAALARARRERAWGPRK